VILSCLSHTTTGFNPVTSVTALIPRPATSAGGHCIGAARRCRSAVGLRDQSSGVHVLVAAHVADGVLNVRITERYGDTPFFIPVTDPTVRCPGPGGSGGRTTGDFKGTFVFQRVSGAQCHSGPAYSPRIRSLLRLPVLELARRD
jgi:hypothetical protein